MAFCNNNNNNYISRYQTEANNVEQIIPQVFLSTDWTFWNPEQLRAHGISHIINIHAQTYTVTATANSTTINDNSLLDCAVGTTPQFLDDCQIIDLTEFEILDLDFAFVSAVLPNCYRAVKFLDKALSNSGTVLFKDRHGKQRVLTLTIAYLMYKYKYNYEKSFQRLQRLHPEPITLDDYFIYQLYEYEPILEVQRSRTNRGHSCSGELRSMSMKRKYNQDTICNLTDLNLNDPPSTNDTVVVEKMES